MRPQFATGNGRRSALRGVVLAGVVLLGLPGTGSAQTPTPWAVPAVAQMGEGLGGDILPISCQSCTPAPGPGYGPGVCGYGKKYGAPGCDIGCVDGGCGEAGCHAGYPGCETCSGQGRFFKLFCAFHDALCCPDPCYEPRWVAAANAALFVPSVRPSTYTRLRWDFGNQLTTPDRGEYFWAAIGQRGPGLPERRVNYNELSLYAEVGTEKFSFFINTPYRNTIPEVNPSGSGFGDLSLGTKSVLVDSELLLLTLQFQTYIPTGLAGRGVGTGHTSLEPSLLWAVKLYPETYWQGQLGYWIPIGGTPGVAGGVLFYNNSINHVLCRPLRDTALIGTIESMGWTFNSGGFTDPNGVVRDTRGVTYFSVGPGLRLSVCDRVDFGFGIQFAVTDDHFADQLYRTELRWRF